MVGLNDPERLPIAEALCHRGEALHIAEHERNGAIRGGMPLQVGTLALHHRSYRLDRSADVGSPGDALDLELHPQPVLD